MTTAQNTNFSKKGFTLVELLVVIAIIAVLAIMGFAAFRGFTGRGNDARREADLKAVGDALEANRCASATAPGCTAVGYKPLADSQFASGAIPTDPRGSTIPYCMDSINNAAPVFPVSKPAAWTTTTCGAGVKFNGGASAAWTALSTSVPAVDTDAWMVCATLENNTVICRNSSQ